MGEAVSSYERSDYRILTKQIKSRLSYGQVIEDCQASLKRLGVEYVDYFVCHAPNAEFDMRDFFRAANQLYKDGRIKNVGVSNFGPRMLQLALDTSDLPIACNQVCFSVADDDVLSTSTYEFCLKNNIPIQAYRTLVSLDANKEAEMKLKIVAKQHQVTIRQALIAYINSYENMTFTIKSSSSKHWQEIKDALEIKLTPEEISAVRNTHRNKEGAFKGFLLV